MFARRLLKGFFALLALVAAPAWALSDGPRYAVDELAFDPIEHEVRAVGWLVAEPGRPALASIELVSEGVDVSARVGTLRRPDVVNHLSRPDALDSGWEAKFSLPPGQPSPSAAVLRFLDESGALIAEAPLRPVVVVPPQPGQARHVAFAAAWALGLALLAGFAFAVRRRSARSGALDRRPAEETARAAVFSAALVLAAFVTGLATPPFQSPDEFDHLKRAYLLSQGEWLLSAPPPSAAWEGSGGDIDRGLLDYMGLYQRLPFDPEAKVDRATFERAAVVAWGGGEAFSPAPGTGYYLPVIYLPQALALGLGNAAGISVDASYGLARLSSLLLAALCLFEALRRWRPSLLQLVLLLLPMTVFQWASASIDALSTAMGLLAAVLVLEQARRREPASVRRFLAVSALVVVVVGCRIQMAPLLLLPLVVAWGWGGRRWLGLAPGFAVAGWVLLALGTTQHPMMASMSVTDKLLAYAQDPLHVGAVLATTFTTSSIVDFYWHSFVGLFGWLDAPLSEAAYAAFAVILGVASTWSLLFAGWNDVARARAAVALIALASALLIPLLLLLMWTSFDSPVVDGVQGRYFLLPALLLAAALAPSPQGGAERLERATSWCAAAVLLCYSLAVTLPTLISRYYF